MRKRLMMLIGMMAMIVACNKNDEENPARYAGRFQGDIDITVDGKNSGTIAAHTITIHPATVGDYSISDNVIILSSGTIKKDVLTLERTRVATGASLNVYEYGTGIFRGDTLQIEFHHDEEKPAGNTSVRETI